MPDLHVSLLLETEKTPNAQRVLARLSRVIGPIEVPTLEPDPRGGLKARFTMPLASEHWQRQVYDAITLAQSFGRGWQLTGDVHHDVSMVANEFSVPGIRWAHVNLWRILPN